jgi:hypothetical protein
MAEEAWTCNRCGRLNSLSRTECKSCQTPYGDLSGAEQAVLPRNEDSTEIRLIIALLAVVCIAVVCGILTFFGFVLSVMGSGELFPVLPLTIIIAALPTMAFVFVLIMKK